MTPAQIRLVRKKVGKSPLLILSYADLDGTRIEIKYFFEGKCVRCHGIKDLFIVWLVHLTWFSRICFSLAARPWISSWSLIIILLPTTDNQFHQKETHQEKVITPPQLEYFRLGYEAFFLPRFYQNEYMRLKISIINNNYYQNTIGHRWSGLYS